MRRVGDWVAANPQIVKSLAAIAASLVGIGTSLAIGGTGFAFMGKMAFGLLGTMLTLGFATKGLLTFFSIAARFGPAYLLGPIAGMAAKVGLTGTVIGSVLKTIGMFAAGLILPMLLKIGAVLAVIGGTIGAVGVAFFAVLSPAKFESIGRRAIDTLRNIFIRGVLGIIKGIAAILTNLPSIIAGVFSKMNAAGQASSRLISKAFDELRKTFIASFTAMLLFATDVFEQLPKLAAWSAGLIVREFILAFQSLNTWILTTFIKTGTAIHNALGAMLLGDFTQAMKLLMGAMEAPSAFGSGLLSGKPPEFAMSEATKRALKDLEGMLGTGQQGTPGAYGGKGSSAFVSYSASAAQGAGTGDRMFRIAEAHKKETEKVKKAAERSAKAAEDLARGLRFGH